jgi:hypothetical protein
MVEVGCFHVWLLETNSTGAYCITCGISRDIRHYVERVSKAIQRVSGY